MSVTAGFLLKGYALALEQCGLLLSDAVRLYESGSYATAVVLTAFACEELGRSKILLGLWRRQRGGSTVTLEDTLGDMPRVRRSRPADLLRRLQVLALDQDQRRSVAGRHAATCHLIRRTSIQSSNSSQNSKPCYERPPSAPWRASGTASHVFSMPSSQMNALTTSETPDMLHGKWKTL
jgi:hypothetical protein